MVKTDAEWAMRVKFDAATRAHFPLFLRRAIGDVAPSMRYQQNLHIDAIAEYQMACERGEVTRLIINLPPRMLKSTIVSVAWPAWLLGHDPTQRIMAASYAQSLSVKHSTDCRVILQAPWFQRLFVRTCLSDDQNEKEKFSTTLRGYRKAVSVGGAAIGEGGNILIVDDPLNPLQASHYTQRETVNQWFDHTWATRLDDKQRGAMVVVMQRLHPNDLSGYLMQKGGWEHLCLAAIAPEHARIHIGKFAYERMAGEALHEAREPLALLKRMKHDLGSANFEAQYQQEPISEQGAIVKPHWFVRFDAAMVEGAQCVQSWDTAVKAGQQHDASACATFVVREGVHHLIDMRVVKLEYPELKREIIQHAARFNPDAVLIEDKASGQSLLQDLRRETQLPLIACMPKVDKLTRLQRITPLMEAGKMALPLHAAWLGAFERELFQFPDGAHDDQVDAVSQYLNWIRDKPVLEAMRIRTV